MTRSFPGVTSARNPSSRPSTSSLVQDAIAVSTYQKDRAHALMPRLKELDPTGWETWFDSDAVPDPTQRGWRGVADAIQARVLVLEARPEFPYDPSEHISNFIMASSGAEYKEIK